MPDDDLLRFRATKVGKFWLSKNRTKGFGQVSPQATVLSGIIRIGWVLLRAIDAASVRYTEENVGARPVRLSDSSLPTAVQSGEGYYEVIIHMESSDSSRV